MGRRIAAGVIALASVGHMILLVVGVNLGWFPLSASSILVLATALLLALLALAASVWVLRTEDFREFAMWADRVFECRQCGRQRQPDHAFCTACGAHE